MWAARQDGNHSKQDKARKSTKASSRRPQIYLVCLWWNIHGTLLLVIERICEALLPRYRTGIERRHISPRPVPAAIAWVVMLLLLLLLLLGPG